MILLTEFAKNINSLLHKKIFEFKKHALKTNDEIENIYNNNEYELVKATIQLIEENVIDAIVNKNKNRWFDG